MSVTRGDILLTVCQQHLLSQVDMTWKEGRWKRVMERGREGGRGGQKDNKQTWSTQRDVINIAYPWLTCV